MNVGDKFFYPPERGGWRDVGIIYYDSLPIPGREQVVYFDPRWKYDGIIVDILAQKYGCTSANYSEQSEKMTILGWNEVVTVKKDDTCIYFRKAMQALDRYFETNPEEKNSVIGITLLKKSEADSANKQCFLAVTRSKLYLRDTHTLKIVGYNFEDLRFTSEGISAAVLNDQNWKHLDAVVLDIDDLDSRFYNFLKEYQILLGCRISALPIGHPCVGSNYEVLLQYLQVLVMVAREGEIDSECIIRLAFLAQEFKIGADKFLQYLKAKLGEKDGLREKIKTVMVGLPPFCRNIFFQDILEIGNLISDEPDSLSVLEILRKKNFAGKEFVDKYLKFVQSRKECENQLMNFGRMLFGIDMLDYEKLLQAYQYNCGLSSEFLRNGVNVNV